ncbi:hypothetical protein PFISCL1PPCAC_7827, partial [Pristionchus fissidentatus]
LLISYCVILHLSSASTLDQTVARLRHRYHQDQSDSDRLRQSISDPESPRHKSAQDLVAEWSQYEKTAGGTGFHMERPDTGMGYRPGMGDIAVRTGLGVAYPFGGFNYRRDFELGMGGSGRLGGREVGWGNGMPGLSWSPWAG